MHEEEENFFDEIQPSASGLTLSLMNNKSSVLCPETQDITSQYLALQQLDAHQKMISRAKGCVDTSPPKSMQSYRSVSSQKKRKMLSHLKNSSQVPIHGNAAEESNGPNSSRVMGYNSEEEENGSIDASFVNKAIQTGIPTSNFTCKTAEKISWYLEALSLGELQSEYFTFLQNHNHLRGMRGRNSPSIQGKKRIVKGDIMQWHHEHFIHPKKPFYPRILADPTAKSKVRDMRCYNPPFRKKKANSSHSSDTFESYEDEENEDDFSRTNEDHKSSEESSVEEETLINRRIPDHDASLYKNTVPSLHHYRRDQNNYSESSSLNKSEEDKYLDFLSKVTEDILRSGVYSDKAIQQAFEFHMQFYKEDPNKEKLQSLLEQVLEGLKVTSDDAEENFQPRKPFFFSLSRPNSPPEKETAALFTGDSSQMAADISSTVNESDGSELDNS